MSAGKTAFSERPRPSCSRAWRAPRRASRLSSPRSYRALYGLVRPAHRSRSNPAYIVIKKNNVEIAVARQLERGGAVVGLAHMERKTRRCQCLAHDYAHGRRIIDHKHTARQPRA